MSLENYINKTNLDNNMRLFLSGGGIGKDSKEIDDLFAKSIDKNKPLLYIPIAMDEKKRSYDECFKFISDTFNPRGINNIVMWTEREIENPKVDLDSFGGIYVGGGNTFYLLKKIKETNFDTILKNAINKNIPYYGGSAGAIICGKTIKPAEVSDKNQVGLKYLSGFGLLNSFSIWCHYKKEKFNLINDLKNYNNLEIIALPEDTSLYCENNFIMIYGSSPTHVFGKDNFIKKPKSRLI
ncbi:MAG: Type 1 glutamine amidotransferase-like domain-containing protein [Bacillota bacterium]